MRRLTLTTLLAAALLATGTMSAHADEPAVGPSVSDTAPDPVDSTELSAPMTAFTTEGIDDEQCMGPAYTPTSNDVTSAKSLLDGYLAVATFKTWRMPMTDGKVDLVKLTWGEDPYANANWVFNFHSLRWADPLRRVGMGGGDGVSDEERSAMLDLYTGLLGDWIRNNPYEKPRSVYSWNDMTVGVRSIGLICASTVLDERPEFEPLLRTGIERHAKSLMDINQYRVVGNHALHQDMGLLALGCSTGTDTWKDVAMSRSTTLLKRSVDTQGVSDEGSMLYQELNYRWYRELKTRIESCGIVPDPYFANIDKMPNILAQATQPDGTIVAYGDTSAKTMAQRIPGTVAEYAATQGLVGTKPDGPLFTIFNRGYAFSRTGWYDTQPGTYAQSLAAIRFGPGMSHSVHGHEDAGNISYFALGKQILWQPGVWGGAGGKPRTYVRSNEAQNSVDIPSLSYDRYATVTKSVTRSYPETPLGGAADLISIRTLALKGAIWKRTMIHAKQANFLVVDDLVTQKKSRTVVQRWHFGADRTVKVSNGRITTSGTGSNSLTLWVGAKPKLDVVRGRTSPMLGWRSESVNHFIKTPTAEASIKGKTVHLTAIIVPRPSNMKVSDIRVIRTWVSGGLRTIDVGIGSKTYRVAFSASTASVKQLG